MIRPSPLPGSLSSCSGSASSNGFSILPGPETSRAHTPPTGAASMFIIHLDGLRFPEREDAAHGSPDIRYPHRNRSFTNQQRAFSRRPVAPISPL
jgi:hypothetical protein